MQLIGRQNIMAEIAKTHQEKLETLKDYVEQSYEYFEHNYNRYSEFMQFVFASALDNDTISKLQALQKPVIEFNILETYISRQRGEFETHEPGLNVGLADGILPNNINQNIVDQINVIDGHLREIIDSSKNDGFQDKIYNDVLSGGFSVAKVYTDYINPYSFEQNICIERVFDPCLCGFDPLARQSHKGDGLYAYEIFPTYRDEFEREFGKAATKNMSFTRNVGSFNWSFNNNNQDILLRVFFYLKKKKKVKIAKLSNGKTILSKHYPQLIEIWNQNGLIEQPPIIIEERMTETETIGRYEFVESTMLEYIETDYTYLPLVFFDGNSVMVKQKGNGSVAQMTRPYVYQAKGIQKLKNFAGQTIANEIENLVQHKFIAAAEAIPEDYRDAYDNVQQAQVLVYNAFYDHNPEQPLPPPQEVQRTPTPPIVQETFMGCDQVTQSILGSYDAQLGITNGNTSGKAIMQGSMHSSAAAKPYLIGYINGLNRIANIILDLIPKYYVTPRTIPIRKPNGLRDYQVINDNSENSIKINYKPHELQVKVEVGVNTALQKQMSLEQIIRLMSASETFARFINENLDLFLDNVDMRGIEQMKLKAGEFMQRMQQMEQAAAQKPSPEQELINAEKEIELARIQQRKEQSEGELQIKASQLAIDKEKADAEFLRLLAEVEEKDAKNIREAQKFDAELTKDAVEMALNLSEHHRNAEENNNSD